MGDDVLLKLLITRGLITTEQRDVCLAEKKNAPQKEILQILLEKGFISWDQAQEISFMAGENSSAGEENEEEFFLSSDADLKIAEGEQQNKNVPISLDMLPTIEEHPLTPKTDRRKTESILQGSLQLSAETHTSIPLIKLEEKKDILELETPYTETLNLESSGLEPSPEPPVMEDTATRSEKDSKKAPAKMGSKTMSTPFGKAAILLHMSTQEQVNDALLSQVTDRKGTKIGEVMVEKGYLTREQVKIILSRQKTRAMACPQCEKPYQIVLFQAGRSYKCSKCGVELVDFKKLEGKKDKGRIVPKEVQIMGLTQTLPKIGSKKYDTGGLDFVEDKEEKQPQSAPHITTTEQRLKEVGIEMPSVVEADLEEQPEEEPVPEPVPMTAENKQVLIGIVVLVVVVMMFFLFGGSSEPEKKPKNPNPGNNTNTSQNKPVAETREEKMAKAYDELKKMEALHVAPDDARTLNKQIGAYENFMRQYPENAYGPEIDARIAHLKDLIEKNNLNKEYEKSLKEYEKLARRVQDNLKKKHFAAAWEDVSKFPAKSKQGDIADKILRLFQDIIQESQKNLEPGVKRSQELLKANQFDAAIKELEKTQKDQIAENIEELNTRIEEIKKARSYYRWIGAAYDINKSIYPMLLERKYLEAEAYIASSNFSNRQEIDENLKKWQTDIAGMKKIWDAFRANLQSLKGWEYEFTFENSSERFFGSLSSFSQNRSLILTDRNKKGRNVKLEELSVNWIKKLLSNKFNFDRPKDEVTLALFLAPWKSEIPVVAPSSKEDQLFCREILALYFLEQTKKFISEDDIATAAKLAKKLAIEYAESSVYQRYQEDVAQPFFQYALKAKKQGKRNVMVKMLELIVKYLPSAPAAEKARAELKK